MKNIGIIGCDGRENAIGKSLLRTIEEIKVFYIGSHSNIGLDNLGAFYENGDILNAGVILDWVKTNNIEFVIIGPEKPLEVGIVDILEENGIECFGPRKILASLETSKLFCRNFLAMLEKKYNLQLNPEYFEFTSQNQLTIFTEKYVKPFVIKQDELAGGKGVQVMGDHFNTSKDGHNICMNLYENNIPFIIEEKLIGSEFSLFSITDGINISHCPPVQDYKRAYENNTGPNTGGMGAIMNYLPFLNEEDIKQAENINKLVIENISNYTDTYKKYKRINPFIEDIFDWKERGKFWTKHDNVTVYNSTILESGTDGIRTVGDHSDVTVYNSTIKDNQWNGIYTIGALSGSTLTLTRLLSVTPELPFSPVAFPPT